LNQFASPQINKRDDEYGGNVANRLRFVGEIISNVRQELGNEFIIGYRMGGNEPTLEDSKFIALELEKLGVDIIHVSSSGLSDSFPEVPKDFNYNWIVYSGTEIKRLLIYR
jgi:NADPH2 dehydrogenase